MAKFGVKEVADVTFYDLITNKPVLFMDSLKISTLENAAESSEARGGKGNGRLLTWDFNRTAKFNIQDALFDPKAVAMQSGSALIEATTQTIKKREILTVAALKVTFTTAAANTTAMWAYKVEDGDNMGTELTTGMTKTVNDITWSAGVINGDKVMVFYEITSNAANTKMITISSNNFPGFYKIVGDTVVRNENTGQDEPFQIVVHKAKLVSNFNITMEAQGDPSTFDFNVEVYKDSNSDEMVRLIKY